MFQQLPPRYFKRNEDIYPHKNLVMNVYNNIIHNSQEMKTTQMSINW